MLIKDYKNKCVKGFTIVEVVVSIGIFITLALITAQIYVLIVSQIVAYREQTTISSLANQYLEEIVVCSL